MDLTHVSNFKLMPFYSPLLKHSKGPHALTRAMFVEGYGQQNVSLYTHDSRVEGKECYLSIMDS